MIRIDKYLADCGIGTRSEVKKYIKAKQISVNGIPVTKPETKVDERTDEVCYQGRKLSYEKYVYYLYHKPSGCVTAREDRRYKTVMDNLPPEVNAKDLAPVGRLDLDTEGLLLLTNDGPLTHHLLSPAHHIPKTYYAILDKEVPMEAQQRFAQGIDIGDDKPTLPASLTILPTEADETGAVRYVAELTICEGRFHQVKRMFEAVGCTVTYLKRLSMGGLDLADLPRGEYRRLLPEEVEALKGMENGARNGD